jgi:fumarate hydratase class II
MNTKTRIETDSIGEIHVPSDKYWGAQTQRALTNFKIGEQRFPPVFIKAFGIIKKAAAMSNCEQGDLSKEQCEYISQACDEIIQLQLNDHFPLVIWQTGSGTQTNMNANEVIANRAIEIAGGMLGSKEPVHPNDHVNMSQSSNDVFPSVMHLAAVLDFHEHLLPSLNELAQAFENKLQEFNDIVKIGRTHLMDAVPLTLGQEFSGYVAQLRFAEDQVRKCIKELSNLVIGGTAIGTGLNATPEYTEKVIQHISTISGYDFNPAQNKFMGIAAHDAIVNASSALRLLATANMKIANDIRLLASGPRCGIGELKISANEPGSSIMPGKVNPTQCEAMTMVCTHVLGLDVAIGVAGMNGQLELNTFKPMMIYNLLESSRLLADAMKSFSKNCIEGIEPDKEMIVKHVENSLMLVTALNKHIGYDNAAKVAKNAFDEGITLKQSADELGFIKESDFDNYVNPEKMTNIK